jgi:hypothetical protein
LLGVAFADNAERPLTLQYDDSSEIAVLFGAFDHPQDLGPRYHYGVEGRLPWVDIGHSLPEQRTEERFDQSNR